MSHNPNPKADTSGFNYPSAAGKVTNTDQHHIGHVASGDTATESSSSVPQSQTYTTGNVHSGPALDINHGKLGDEHGGAGTRHNDRKGETVQNEGDTTSPTAQHHQP